MIDKFVLPENIVNSNRVPIRGFQTNRHFQQVLRETFRFFLSQTYAMYEEIFVTVN